MGTKKMAGDKNDEYVIVIEKCDYESQDLKIISKNINKVKEYIEKIQPDFYYKNSEISICYGDEDIVLEKEFYDILNNIFNKKRTKLYFRNCLKYEYLNEFYCVRLVKLLD